MKLPKGLGGGMGGGLMANVQNAMARAQNLEQELETETINVDKGPVKATFDGTGRIQTIKIDKSVVDPDDVEALEDLITGAIRDGFEKAVELRADRVSEITKGLPPIPGLGL
ncbi:MAG: YbaB/EbfC family nucleoid-associated protein [Armatimonadetes bacterium]|nr:YbaB/EbfC family nucleoid-associated protein [Armatimonadota bacterium]MBS1700426.1 YbaB/EbfC family nucleoid-associated protein [Armatimonadota bacterium]